MPTAMAFKTKEQEETEEEEEEEEEERERERERRGRVPYAKNRQIGCGARKKLGIRSAKDPPPTL